MDCEPMYSSTPTVDETVETCSEITSTDCATVPFDNLNMMVFRGDSLTDVLIKIMNKIQNLENHLPNV